MSFFTKDKAFYRSFFGMTAMMALQNVIVCSVNLADNIMLGGYSEAALSGAALANQIQFILQMLTMGIGDGIMVLSSQYWGKREVTPIKRLMTIGLSLGIVFSLFLWAAMFFFPEACLGLFTNDSAVIAEGVKYLRIICFSYVFFTMTNILLCSLRSVETVRIGFIISLSTLCINVCLNYILIYGNFGAPEMGSAGAATATLISRTVEFIIMASYLKWIDKKVSFTLKDVFILDKILFWDYIKVGIPVFLSNTIWGVAMAIQTSILGHLGGQSIAANSVATTVFQILSVVAYGSAGAASVLTGKTVGEGRQDKIKEYTKTFQVLFLCIGICSGLGLFLIKDVIITFYAISGETKELALQFITVLAVTIVGTSYQVPCLTGVVRGGGDTRFVLYNDLIFMWLIVLPLSAITAFWLKWPPVAVFAVLKCDQVLKPFVALVKVNRYSWIKTLTR